MIANHLIVVQVDQSVRYVCVSGQGGGTLLAVTRLSQTIHVALYRHNAHIVVNKGERLVYM